MPPVNRDLAFGLQIGHTQRRFEARTRASACATKMHDIRPAIQNFFVRRALAAALFRTLGVPQNSILAWQQGV
jgi:hypothetical protein